MYRQRHDGMLGSFLIHTMRPTFTILSPFNWRWLFFFNKRCTRSWRPLVVNPTDDGTCCFASSIANPVNKSPSHDWTPPAGYVVCLVIVLSRETRLDSPCYICVRTHST
mmetsp:Transcript_16835/g.28035  ORF Transcript_16835/g.28035 Transcript_16835/m.28035 type:complete len:109 (-) Transcript_16835:235-561(-)